MDQWTPRPSSDPRATKGSPEALAQAEERHQILKSYGHRKAPGMPTIAEIASMRSPLSIALAHGQVLRSIYRIDYKGHWVNEPLHAPEVLRYLTEIVRYLCETRAGILMRREPFAASADAEAAKILAVPEHFRDARLALRTIQQYGPHPKDRGKIPHDEILGAYLDNGYFSDDPQTRMAVPSARLPSWKESAVEHCNHYMIKAMLMRGVDFDALLTAEAIARARSYVTRPSETGSKFLSPHYAAIDDVKPGDFLGFFRIFGTPVEDPGNREVVRMLEAAKMTRQIDQATLERSSEGHCDVSPPPARRRAAL